MFVRGVFLSLALFCAPVVWADDSGSADRDTQNISDRLRGVYSGVLSEVSRKVIVRLEERALSFPDFAPLAAQLEAEILAAQAKFEDDLLGIGGVLEDKYSDYVTAKRAAKENPKDKALKEVYRSEAAAFSRTLNATSDQYLKAAKNLILLNEKLSFPVKIRMKLSGSMFEYLIPGINVYGLVDIFVDGLCGRDYRAVNSVYDTVINVESPQLLESGDCKTKGRIVYAVEKSLASKGSELFGQCKTKGCVYYLAEAYFDWVRSSQKALKVWLKPDGMDDIEWPAVEVNAAGKGAIYKTFMKMADAKAFNLPLGTKQK